MMNQFIWQSFKLTQWLIVTLLAAVLWLGHSGIVHAAEPAGFVLMAVGKVQALQTNNSLRKLRRKSPFFAGETLVVSENSKAQVRFSDGSLISLRPATQIRIDEYRFNEGYKGEDKNIFTLLNGGFRTITGKIGKKNPDNYQMKSSVASIGVRGTTYEVVLDKTLSVAAWQGTIILKNQAGEMTLGSEGLYNFAVVSSSKSVPRGMMRPPAVIGDEKEIRRDEKGSDSDPSEGEKKEGEAHEKESDDQQGTNLSDKIEGELEAGSLASEAMTDDAGEQEVGSTDNEVDTIVAEEAVPEPAPEIIPDSEVVPAPVLDPIPEPIIEPVPVSEPVVDVDLRISGITLDRIAMAVSGGISQQGMLIGGNAGYESGSLVIADNGYGPNEALFDSAPYQTVMKQGNASLLNSGTITIDATHSVNWNEWSGAVLLTDATDLSISNGISQTVYWIETTASPVAAFSRTGLISYQNILSFVGSGSGGAVAEVYLNLSVNFDTSVATGSGSIKTPNELWKLSLNGNLMAPVLDFSSVTGTVNGQAIEGEFSSVFTGETAQAIVSSFDLQAIANPSIHVEGLVVTDETAIGDLRLSPADLANLDRVGVAMIQDGQAGPRWISGQASDGSSGIPLFVEKGFPLSSPVLINAPAVEVLRIGNGSMASTYAAPTYPVHWGTWYSGAQVQTDAYDPLAVIELPEMVRWMTVTAASDVDMTARIGTGLLRYTPIYAEGNTDLNAALGFTALGLTVNFDSGSFVGSAHMQGAAATEIWNMNFDGTITVAELSVVNMKVNRTDANGNNSLAATGELSMLFTGTGDAVAGAYELELADDASQYITGNFLLGIDQRLTSAQLSILDRVGFGVHSSTLGGMHWTAGLASDGSVAGLVLTDNGFSLGSPHQQEAPILDLLQEGGTAALAMSSHSTLPVSWGVWAAGAQLQSPAAPGLITTLIDPVVWLTALPTSNTSILAMSGKALYSFQKANDNGSGNLPNVGWSYMSVLVDFDLNKFEGFLYSELGAGVDVWDVNFEGGLVDARLGVETTTVDFNGDGTDGLARLGLLLTGTPSLSGDPCPGVAGVFDLEQLSNSSTFVQSTFVAELDQRLTVTEYQELDHIGMFAGNSGVSRYAFASSGDNVAIAPFFVTDWRVFRVGTATENRATPVLMGGDAAYTVNWGSWNGNIDYQWDPANATNQSSIADNAHWATFLPTPQGVIANKTGSITYDSPQGVLAHVGYLGAAIDETSLSFNAVLNFDNSTMTGSMFMAESTGVNPWDISNFNATLGPTGLIKVNSLTGTYNAISIDDFGTQMRLTGPNAEGLVGQFNWGASVDSVRGVFVVCQTSGC